MYAIRSYYATPRRFFPQQTDAVFIMPEVKTQAFFHRPSSSARKRECDAAADPRGAFDPDRPAMRFDNLPGDAHPQAETPDSGVCRIGDGIIAFAGAPQTRGRAASGRLRPLSPNRRR